MKLDNIIHNLKLTLDDTLHLNGRSNQWENQTSLLGNIPELDSIAVLNVITAIELRFSFKFDDEEINTDLFTSVESLGKFIEYKIQSNQN